MQRANSILVPIDFSNDSRVQVAEHYKARAIFMGYGEKGGNPGPVAAGVKSKFSGFVELFSETMAGLISQAA